MQTRQGMVWLVLLWAAACGPNRYELFQRLPEKDKEIFTRTQQFMTDGQQEQYLLIEDSDARARMVEGLRVQDRLAKFPTYIQEAILGQRLVPGMTGEMVLLSWGRPKEIDRRDADGVPTECWTFLRGEQDGRVKEKRVYFLSGLVTEVSP